MATHCPAKICKLKAINWALMWLTNTNRWVIGKRYFSTTIADPLALIPLNEIQCHRLLTEVTRLPQSQIFCSICFFKTFLYLSPLIYPPCSIQVMCSVRYLVITFFQRFAVSLTLLNILQGPAVPLGLNDAFCSLTKPQAFTNHTQFIKKGNSV